MSVAAAVTRHRRRDMQYVGGEKIVFACSENVLSGPSLVVESILKFKLKFPAIAMSHV